MLKKQLPDPYPRLLFIAGPPTGRRGGGGPGAVLMILDAPVV